MKAPDGVVGAVPRGAEVPRSTLVVLPVFEIDVSGADSRLTASSVTEREADVQTETAKVSNRLKPDLVPFFTSMRDDTTSHNVKILSEAVPVDPPFPTSKLSAKYKLRHNCLPDISVKVHPVLFLVVGLAPAHDRADLAAEEPEVFGR